MTCGIYKITNTVNGKVYIGSSVNIEGRFLGHISKLKNGREENRKLQTDVDKYGIDAFTFETVEELEINEAIIHEREQYWTTWAWENAPGCYNRRRAMPRVAYQLEKQAVESGGVWQQWLTETSSPDFLADIQKQITESGLTYSEIERQCGLPASTICRLITRPPVRVSKFMWDIIKDKMLPLLDSRVAERTEAAGNQQNRAGSNPGIRFRATRRQPVEARQKEERCQD